MYYDYFGFKQPPFRITPDTSLFYPGGDRGAILEALVYAILNGEGIIKVVGEVGSGKTMLCRMLEQELPDSVEVVYLVNPSISPENTLHAIAFELKLAVNSSTSRFEVMNELQKYLLQRHSQNRQVVVFVEEAQSMPIATLEEIRLLSNLETQQSKLLQIVLFGQPELDEMISRPEIRQLKERITYSFQLTPFKTNDIREYINTRVRACGNRSGDLFTEAALKQIEQHSKGLLRRINILADKSLLAAFADSSHKVSVKHTRLAARDSEFLPRRTWPVIPLLIAGGILSLLLLAAVLFWPDEQLAVAPVDPVTSEAVPVAPAAKVEDLPPQVIPEQAEAPELPAPAVETAALTVESPPATPVTVTSPEPAALPDTGTEIAAASPSPTISSVTDTVIEATPTPAPAVVQSENTDLSGIEEVNDISKNLEEDTVSTPAQIPENTTSVEPDNGLLGMSSVYQIQDFADSGLTQDEVAEMQSQLRQFPPESFENRDPTSEADICTRCWSIIYRPLPISKNL
jgi:MSHA biogenesis protein MshM